MTVLATCLGFPRVGAKRELKQALDRTWQGTQSGEELLRVARTLRQRHWLTMKRAGIDHVPCNDFSLYDHVLDTTVMLGLVPKRYRRIREPLTRYFAMARGLRDEREGLDVAALEMTKWFDTNYHYSVPELEPHMDARLDGLIIVADVNQERAAQLSATDGSGIRELLSRRR